MFYIAIKQKPGEVMKEFDASDILNDERMELLNAHVFQGNSLAELTGTTETELAAIFHNARISFASRKFNQAAMLCCHLCMQDHRNKKYWELFGLSMVRMEKYGDARTAFSRAMFLDIKNPAYPFYLAQILEIEEGLKAARPAYLTVLEFCNHVKSENIPFIKKNVLEKLKGAGSEH